jgi:hypothetical protein
MEIKSFFSERTNNGESRFDTFVRWFCIISIPTLITALIVAQFLRK